MSTIIAIVYQKQLGVLKLGLKLDTGVVVFMPDSASIRFADLGKVQERVPVVKNVTPFEATLDPTALASAVPLIAKPVVNKIQRTSQAGVTKVPNAAQAAAIAHQAAVDAAVKAKAAAAPAAPAAPAAHA